MDTSPELGIEGIKQCQSLIGCLQSRAMEIKYKIFSVNRDICKNSTIQCAINGIQIFHSKSQENDLDSNNIDIKTFRRLINRDSFAAGFFAKQVACILSYFLQALILFLTLLYVNTLITISIFVLSCLLLIFYSHSYLKVARQSNDKQNLSETSKMEIKNLYHKIELNSLDNKDINQLEHTFFQKGKIGEYLNQKILMRKNIKRGASYIEYANPLGLIILGIFALNIDHLDFSIGIIVIYLLLLKQLTICATQAADGFITINRVHTNLINYLSLIGKIRDIND